MSWIWRNWSLQELLQEVGKLSKETQFYRQNAHRSSIHHYRLYNLYSPELLWSEVSIGKYIDCVLRKRCWVSLSEVLNKHNLIVHNILNSINLYHNTILCRTPSIFPWREGCNQMLCLQHSTQRLYSSYTGRERLIRSHSSARFCFKLSGSSN